MSQKIIVIKNKKKGKEKQIFSVYRYMFCRMLKKYRKYIYSVTINFEHRKKIDIFFNQGNETTVLCYIFLSFNEVLHGRVI